jgi:hypothetical protein
MLHFALDCNTSRMSTMRSMKTKLKRPRAASGTVGRNSLALVVRGKMPFVNKVRAAAKKRGLSVSAFVRAALKARVG